jgi:excisionase family DNA binding protein
MFQQMPSAVQGHLTVKEAAARLGVGPNDIRRLIEAGSLPGVKVGQQWLIPTDAVERRREIGPRRGRRLSPARAWGLLYLADGRDAPWLTSDARWRIRRRLATHTLAADRDRLIDRGRPIPYRAHPSMLDRMRADPHLMLTGVSAASALRLGLVGGPDEVDVYVDHALLDDVVERYRLRPSTDPNVTLRPVPAIGWDWPPTNVAPRPAVALDLLDHAEPRVRQVGSELVDRIGR